MDTSSRSDRFRTDPNHAPERFLQKAMPAKIPARHSHFSMPALPEIVRRLAPGSRGTGALGRGLFLWLRLELSHLLLELHDVMLLISNQLL